MSQRVKLPKELVIGCYALCRQAERSLDRALFAPWADFAAYYGPDRVSALETATARLGATLPQAGVPQAPPRLEEVDRPRVLEKALVLLLAKLGLLRKTTFAYREPEIRFVVARMQALVKLLGSKEKPAPEEIITCRMGMYSCQRLLEEPCYGLPELKRANRVEHFLYPEHLRPVKLEEVIG